MTTGSESSKTNFEKVLEFTKTYGAYFAPLPSLPDQTTIDLRIKLVQEEWNELMSALDRKDITAVADALGDLEYVLNGFALACGINLDDIVTEIHWSNMTKLGEDGKPIYREDGKVLKGPNYQPPNLVKILQIQKPIK